mmetsp:Transcript_37969/g.109223  ORF Transcript_37969/g.109223 Transcript_37969/m.109223 type:complete len:201 (+) Transcript_37969:875-1477(+)
MLRVIVAEEADDVGVPQRLAYAELDGQPLAALGIALERNLLHSKDLQLNGVKSLVDGSEGARSQRVALDPLRARRPRRWRRRRHRNALAPRPLRGALAHGLHPPQPRCGGAAAQGPAGRRLRRRGSHRGGRRACGHGRRNGASLAREPPLTPLHEHRRLRRCIDRRRCRHRTHIQPRQLHAHAHPRGHQRRGRAAALHDA